VSVPLFSEDTTYAVLFREMVSLNYCNLIKVIRDILEKIAVSFFEPHMKGLYFYSQNILIDWASVNDG
jgi:hypothetical protein